MFCNLIMNNFSEKLIAIIIFVAGSFVVIYYRIKKFSLLKNELITFKSYKKIFENSKIEKSEYYYLRSKISDETALNAIETIFWAVFSVIILYSDFHAIFWNYIYQKSNTFTASLITSFFELLRAFSIKYFLNFFSQKSEQKENEKAAILSDFDFKHLFKKLNAKLVELIVFYASFLYVITTKNLIHVFIFIISSGFGLFFIFFLFRQLFIDQLNNVKRIKIQSKTGTLEKIKEKLKEKNTEKFELCIFTIETNLNNTFISWAYDNLTKDIFIPQKAFKEFNENELSAFILFEQKRKNNKRLFQNLIIITILFANFSFIFLFFANRDQFYFDFGFDLKNKIMEITMIYLLLFPYIILIKNVFAYFSDFHYKKAIIYIFHLEISDYLINSFLKLYENGESSFYKEEWAEFLWEKNKGIIERAIEIKAQVIKT